MWQAVVTLDEKFQDRIDSPFHSLSHDRQKITSSDEYASVQWEDALSVFSTWISGNASGLPVTTLTNVQVGDLRTSMWEMTEIDSDTHTDTHTETVREIILTLTISHKVP